MGWIPAYAGGWFCLVGQLTIRRKTQFRGRICSSEDACSDGNAMIYGHMIYGQKNSFQPRNCSPFWNAQL